MEYQKDAKTGCWIWSGTIAGNGYGIMRMPERKTMVAHRFVFLSVGRVIPVGMELDHLCRNRRCVNPDHLEPVTHSENMLRAFAAAGRASICKYGHPLDGIRSRSGGGRYCKQCNLLNKQKQRAASL